MFQSIHESDDILRGMVEAYGSESLINKVLENLAGNVRLGTQTDDQRFYIAGIIYICN